MSLYHMMWSKQPLALGRREKQGSFLSPTKMANCIKIKLYPYEVTYSKSDKRANWNKFIELGKGIINPSNGHISDDSS